MDLQAEGARMGTQGRRRGEAVPVDEVRDLRRAPSVAVLGGDGD